MSSSWDEEFGAGATAEVQRALDAVDGFLYEGTCVGSLGGELEAECRRWADAFVHLRAVGRGITPPTPVEARNASPKESNSGSAQSNCEPEPAVSPTEDPLKDDVADRLCALFWPEVELWLRLCKERPVSKHSGAGKPHGRLGREAPGLEGVLTVGPKLLGNRHVGGDHDTGPPRIPPGRSWSDGSSLPPLSSEGSRSSSNLPASSTSSRQGTSSGSSVSRLPPIGSLSLGSLCLEGRRMSVTSRPPTRSARGSRLPKH